MIRRPRSLLLKIMSVLLAATLAFGAPAGAAEPYRLGPNDQIEVNIANYPDLKTVTRVAADGTIILPLVGAVPVVGLGPPDAANAIAARYVNGGFIKLPTVRVEVLDYQSRKASVLGQVNAQGLVVLDRSYSVAEIIAKAGGLGPEAADTAVIVRQKPDGQSERVSVNLGEQIAAAGGAALTEVRAGDVVFVPKMPTFSVIGAVSKPGTYPLMAGMTVQQALAVAGDITRIGTRSGLKVRRAGATGGTAQTLVVTADDPVRPGDVITVRERLF